MKPPKRKRCPCGAWILWARDGAGDWVDLDPQATLDRAVADPLVVWHLDVTANREHHVLPLAEFIELHGPYTGPVWQRHMNTCPEMDRPAPQLSARGRRLLEILGGGRRNGGAA